MTRGPQSAGLDLGQAVTAGVVCCCIVQRVDRCTEASRKRQRSLRPIEFIVTGPAGASGIRDESYLVCYF